MAFADLLSRLDPRPNVRGDQFERICAWYLRSAPEYRGRFRRVWLWGDWPGAWGPEAGIDLVAEEHGGDLWAIQAKAYDPDYAIKKTDVDSFLAESSRPDFAYRLLIATTNRLGPMARRTLDAQAKPAIQVLRSELELAPVSWPASPEDLRPSRPARKKPFLHVKEAVTSTVNGFEDTDRGRLLMACGTGKTLAAMWIAERLDSKRTLILVPSLSLLRQTLREWTANASKPFDYLAVCSDETVPGRDEFVQHTSELGLPVTTDPRLIAAFLRRRGRRVVFATYQSSPQIAAAYEGRVPGFDLAVADEAHRCAGRVGTEFTTILDREQIKAKRRLFMTATPRIYTPRVRREAGMLDVEVASMDDEAVFGPVLHCLSFGEAIERDLLSDYQVVVVGVDDETYRVYAERGELVTRDGTRITDARTLAGQIGLAKSMRKYQLRRIVSFHGRIKAAREFSTEMPDVIAWMPPRARPSGALWSNHVEGAMTSWHRGQLLLRFRDLEPSERGLLSNARCLGEGVDVPSIDGVAFIDPRHSTIDIVQALGRAIRKSRDKKIGTIVLPVFLSEAEDPDQVLDDSAFKHVWDVLTALRGHDERLGDELDELRRRLGARRSPPRRPGKIKLDLPPTGRVGAEFVQAFNARLVEQTTASWEYWLGLLERYNAERGTSRVPRAYVAEDGSKLGLWAQNQRAFYRRGELPADRAARLEVAFPDWTWEPYETKWAHRLGLLRDFRQREGHVDVQLEHVEKGFSLGAWVNIQRQAHRTGRLAPDRERDLEAVEGWEWYPQEAGWKRAVTLLRRYHATRGTTRVETTYKDPETGFALGRWVVNQRQERKAGRLRSERQRELEAIGDWSWDTGKDRWEVGFQLALAYAHERGHASIPSDCQIDGYPLGSWANTQRRFFRKGKLSKERAERLAAIPGWRWNVRDAGRELGLAELRAFVERNGHARVLEDYVTPDGFKLGYWVRNQRSRRMRGLTPDQRARFERLLQTERDV